MRKATIPFPVLIPQLPGSDCSLFISFPNTAQGQGLVSETSHLGSHPCHSLYLLSNLAEVT